VLRNKAYLRNMMII